MGQAETDGRTSPVLPWARKSCLVCATAYIRTLAILAFLVMCLLILAQLYLPGLHPSGRFPLSRFTVLFAIALFTEIYTIRVDSRIEISAGFLVYFLSTAIIGPLASFAIAVGSQLPGLREREWERSLYYASTIAVVTGSTSLLYWFLLSRLGGFEHSSPAIVATLGLGIGILNQLFNFALVAPVVWLRGGLGLRQAWRLLEKPFLPFMFFFLAISIGLVAVYQVYVQHLGYDRYAELYITLIVILSLLPVLGVIYAFRAYVHQRELAKTNARLAVRNERLALQAVASQITALDLKDDYTARHSAAVAQWATDIAEGFGLSERECNLTHLASLLHDVGKIGIPDEVLKSPARLDRANWTLIEGHCYNGYRILSNIDEFEELATVVLHHHERYDGSGYPGGLVGGQIPLPSRIICVADSYSAMVSHRPYGPPLVPEIAMAELEVHRGTQFDPDVVECFLNILEASDDAYRCGEHVDFDMEVQAVKFLRDLPTAAWKTEEPQPASRSALRRVAKRLAPRAVFGFGDRFSVGTDEQGSSDDVRTSTT